VRPPSTFGIVASRSCTERVESITCPPSSRRRRACFAAREAQRAGLPTPSPPTASADVVGSDGEKILQLRPAPKLLMKSAGFVKAMGRGVAMVVFVDPVFGTWPAPSAVQGDEVAQAADEEASLVGDVMGRRGSTSACEIVCEGVAVSSVTAA